MWEHHASARIWATAAWVVAVLHAGSVLDAPSGWWLPLHLVLLGAASQLIVGGQLMFSATISRSKTPSSAVIRAQLVLLNVGAAAVIAGRLAASPALLAVGGAAFLVAVIWAGLAVRGMWRRSLDSRFGVMPSFYGAAALSILGGATIGIAMGAGFVGAGSYAGHRLAHMALNLYGWAGLTILGTAVTLLPAVLRVRIPDERGLRMVPWTVLLGLGVLTGGLTFGSAPVTAAGGGVVAVSLLPFAALVREVLRTPRRHRIPVSAWHLMAALAWLGTVTVAQIALAATGRPLRDLWIVGLGGGLVVQAVLGAWAFLLPAARSADPDARRRHLVAFEIGALPQVAAYNAGLLCVVGSLYGVLPDVLGTVGLWLVLAASGWALVKSWTFPRLAEHLGPRTQDWWAPVR